MEKVKTTQLEFVDFEKQAEEEVKSKVGFWITDFKPIDKIKNSKADNGIYSGKFGTTSFDDNDAFKERYSCVCGTLQGTIFEGCVCVECDSTVTFRDDDINITGWFKMNMKVIHPTMYKILESVIGKKDLVEILLPPKLTVNGNASVSDKPFMNIGMIEFHRRFDDIIEHYMEKKHRWKNKVDEYNLIHKNRHIVFTSCLPVYSLILRPVSIFGGVFQYNKINKEFSKLSMLVSQVNKVKFIDIEETKVLKLLDNIQTIYMNIYKHSIDIMAKSKKSLIRAQMLGAKFNFVARNVITPNNDKCRINEVTMSYLGFIELFKPEIINIMCRTLGYDMSKAYNTWFEATLKFDSMIYEIMLSMIENPTKPIKVLINRNPSKFVRTL